MTPEEHRTRLEEMAEALRGEGRKPVQAQAALKRYIRNHQLAADVALFPDGTVRVIWQE